MAIREKDGKRVNLLETKVSLVSTVSRNGNENNIGFATVINLDLEENNEWIVKDIKPFEAFGYLCALIIYERMKRKNITGE